MISVELTMLEDTESDRVDEERGTDSKWLKLTLTSLRFQATNFGVPERLSKNRDSLSPLSQIRASPF